MIMILRFFKKLKIVTMVLDLKLKLWLVTIVLKIIITNHDFNFNFLKKFKSIIINFSFGDIIRKD